MKNLIDVLSEDMELENVIFSMEDEHAVYYYAEFEKEKFEVKVIHDDKAVYFRGLESEDWHYQHDLEEPMTSEKKEEVIKEAVELFLEESDEFEVQSFKIRGDKERGTIVAYDTYHEEERRFLFELTEDGNVEVINERGIDIGIYYKEDVAV